MLLNSIQTPKDLRSLSMEQLKLLSDELRLYIIDTILESGGHFAGNLGVVELTVALHHSLNFESDTLVWDVGHQSYPHKCLSGRYHQLKNIRNFGEISGFPKREESTFDHFGTGHSSTSISATMGMAQAAETKTSVHVAVIGDGALTAGMSFEALNNLWESNLNVLVILNDNNMGIDPNTGALNSHLTNQRIEQIKSFVEFFGLEYNGPVDGHDLNTLLPALTSNYCKKGPRLLHVRTIKGKGYEPAEKEQTKWHSASKFVKVESSHLPKESTPTKWQDVFGKAMEDICRQHPDAIGITPAMPSSCGMMKAMESFPDRIFDVGIAEQHALTFAAGYATSGKKPIVNIYSSFLQRAYDQWIHDIALQNLPVILCIDRAGLVGEDGPTHHGAFDISFLRCIPNTLLLSPQTGVELYCQLMWAMHQSQPVAIRYPKGNIPDSKKFDALNGIDSHTILTSYNPYNPNWICPEQKNKPLLLSTGWATELAQIGNVDTQIPHLHLSALHSHAYPELNTLLNKYSHIITVEDGSITGGWGSGIISELLQSGWRGTFQHLGIPNSFVTHGNNSILYDDCGYSPMKIKEQIQQALAKN